MAGADELLIGVALGFTLAVPPGPMNALIAAESVKAWRRGFLTGLGAMSADGVLAVVIYALSQNVDLQAYLRAVYAVGAVVMTYFALRLLRPAPAGTAAPAGVVRTYSTALGLGLSNPLQILWWLTAGLAFAYLGGLVVFAGLFGAIAVWITLFPWAIHEGAQRSARAQRVVVALSGVILAAFAVYFAILAA